MSTIVITGVILFALLVTGTLLVYKKKTKYVVAIIAAALIGFFGLGVGAAYSIGLSAAQTGAVAGFGQFLNGTVVDANVVPFNCDRDGPCTRTEDCDSYTVMISAAYTDKDGYHPEVDETEWHQCPEMTKEYSYVVTYTTHADGSHPHTLTIADHIFDAKPVRWRSDVDVPGSGSVPRGIPAAWQKLKDDKYAGNADPITVPDTYENYILANEGTLLKAYSGDIKTLQKAHLLPVHTANMDKGLDHAIHNFTDADKMSFVGFTPSNAAAWQSALMHFNAALGVGVSSGASQGDMHIVAIKASVLDMDPASYLNAIKAYWLNDLGKNAIAKNGIILVLGVDSSGTTIQWAQAATGMPIGNNEMLQMLQNSLPGVAFDPAKVLGNVKAKVVNNNGNLQPQYICDDGLQCGDQTADLRQLALVQGIVFNEFPFARACMGCNSADDKAKGKGGQGFVYLKTEIPLAGSALVWTDILYVISMVVLWFVVFVVAIPYFTMGNAIRDDLSEGSYPRSTHTTRSDYLYR